MSKSKIKSADLGDLPPGTHGMGGGLYLRVSPGKVGFNRNWILRFTLAGKADNMGLGRYPDVVESVARQKAAEYRALAKAGIDPKAHRDARTESVKVKEVAAKSTAVKSITFAEMAEQYLVVHRDEWTDRPGGIEQQYRSKLSNYVYPVLGALPVRDIDTDLMLKVLSPIWKTLARADLVRNLIERILEMATAQGYREGENPARWKILRYLGLASPSLIHKTKNRVALPYEQIQVFMATLRSVDRKEARALELAILCGGRMDEIRCATWPEFDFDARLWTIPAMRTKTGKKSGLDHQVPLSDRAMAILNAMPRISNYVFPARYAHGGRNPNTFPMANNKMLLLLQDICDWRDRDGRLATVHGLRSAFRDWAGDCTDFDRDTIEMQLAHKVVKGAEAAYRRTRALEKRRRLVEAWSDYCMGRSNVVPFQKDAG
jgi:integrase